MDNSYYAKLFANRAVVCFFLIMLLMLSSMLRVAIITTGNYSTVQSQQSAYRITVSNLRGTIYDCNMIPITNNKTKIIAAVSPTPKAVVGISTALDGGELQTVLNTLSQNKPAVCEIDEPIECDGISCTTVYKNASAETPSCHLIGYTDSTGHGVSGLQKAYDDLLYSEKTVSAVYTKDGKGDVLSGISPYFENDLSVVASGVVTTLDINIQNIAQKASEGITSGAVLVANAKDGKIRASVSLPTYDITDISASLKAENSPLLNRALSAYSVGSVFKPCVAAAAIEAGKGGFIFNCTGSTQIADRAFRCHKLDGHGIVDLRTALAQSCNCFFYNFAISLGGEGLYKMTSSLGFGSSFDIAENLSISQGSMPSLKALTNDGAIANLSIGQGEVLLSPVSMLTLYCAIANGGYYCLPSVVEKTIKNGRVSMYDSSCPTKVMSENTANLIKNHLKSVITEGTGTDAAPTLTTAAGKTATAQTGRYDDNGIEITNSWFCGFFPADEPQYVVIVMSEGASQVSAASVFAKIADGVTKYETKP